MKDCLAICLIVFFTASCNQDKHLESNLSDVNLINSGNVETNRRWKHYESMHVEINDSLKNRNFLRGQFQEIECTGNFIPENDYDNQKEAYFLREYSIKFADTIEIRVLQKQAQKVSHIYTYNNKPFKVHNFFGDMFSDSDISFTFDFRRCYQISSSIFLMREQPIRWCGLANRYDMFQLIDLEKMEMIQFADLDEKLK